MESLEMLANNLANIETGGYKADREFYSLYTGARRVRRPADRRHLHALRHRKPVDRSFSGRNARNLESPRLRHRRRGHVCRPDSDRRPLHAQRQLSSLAGWRPDHGGRKPAARDRAAGKSSCSRACLSRCFPTAPCNRRPDVIGQLDVVCLRSRQLWIRSALNYFAPLAGATAKPASGVVLQGKIEQSNVGSAESSVRLVAIMRQFEMLQKAMNIGNELNRHAIEEVARVALHLRAFVAVEKSRRDTGNK